MIVNGDQSRWFVEEIVIFQFSSGNLGELALHNGRKQACIVRIDT